MGCAGPALAACWGAAPDPQLHSPSIMGRAALAAGPSVSRTFLSSATVVLLYAAPNSTHSPALNPSQVRGTCFSEASVGAGARWKGTEVAMSSWKPSTPVCTSTCPVLKVPPNTPWESRLPGEMITDNSKCQSFTASPLVLLQPAKPARLQCGEHPRQAQRLLTHHASTSQR